MKKYFSSVLILLIALSFTFNDINGKGPMADPSIFELKNFIDKGYYLKFDHNIIGIVQLYGKEDKCLICYGADTIFSDLYIEIPFGVNATFFGIIFIIIAIVSLILFNQSKRSKVESKAEE
ncbi:MAG: hypothetical protein COA79_15200 [Planctomycetota bacterium]|nr:MAG: hypothetical protein COA79_15200 [Planctomycetota bacterium]